MNDLQQRRRGHELFNRFAFSVIEESLARVQQAKEYLDDHKLREEPDQVEVTFWSEEFLRRHRELRKLTEWYRMHDDWEEYLIFFQRETENNYSTIGALAKFYRFLTNERLPFDED